MNQSLPREVLKWVQGLDLSYSIKDPKRDLINGFLVAEIFQRYYQGKIQMHSFENSMRLERRQNNWNLLKNFINKNQINISNYEENIDIIVKDLDQQTLIKLINQIYQVLTQKTLSQAPLANIVSRQLQFDRNQQDKNHSQQFLLKEKGLEKIEMKNFFDEQNNQLIQEEIEKQNESQSQQNNSMQSSFKKTNFVRNQPKPISNVNEQNYTIDVKSVNVRTVNLTINKLKEKTQQINVTNISKQNLESSNQNPKIQSGADLTHTNNPKNQTGILNNQKKESKLIEKNIYEILNEILLDKLSLKQFQSESKKIQGSNVQIIQYFIDNLEIFSDEFCCNFFEEITVQLDNILKFVSKDPNESWKFLNFLFSSLKGIGNERQQFKIQINIIQQYSNKVSEFSNIVLSRTRYVFKEYFLKILLQEIKNSLNFERKEELVKLIYCFCGSDGNSRLEMITEVKSQLKDMNIFLQIVSVVIKLERKDSEDNNLLLNEMVFIGKTYMNSQQINNRVMALSIIESIIDINYELVYQLIISHQQEISSYNWWECKCISVLIFSKLIKRIVNSDKYKQLSIIQNQANNKIFTQENEQMIQDLKDRVYQFAKSINNSVFPSQSELVIKITLINIVDIIHEHKILLELFVNLLLQASPSTRQWALTTNDQSVFYEYLMLSEKSLKYNVAYSNLNLQLNSSHVLIFLAQLFAQQLVQFDQPFIDILYFTFQNVDFKTINIEIVEQICNVLKNKLFILLTDKQFSKTIKFIIEKLLNQQFQSEVHIKDSHILFAEAINTIYEANQQICIENVESILTGLVYEAFEQGVKQIKYFLQDVYNNLFQFSFIKNYINQDSKLKQLFQLTVEQMDVEKNSN